ncbi:hypothetical protein N0V83_001516 [Neocucurbitaria cava]|uniref:Uncharacterized protein n=1 Tax=Neocucurbitaria cava TaxID=798079 RepID=A0A9W8YII1_9PLEO|nr:hypothetical protein N0V83_001516 [Neocucurbitaria cava]
MSGLSLEDFDKHIEALRTQLQFLNESLEATDHHAPDWLATDLISLRNKSGRLQDDMKRFRDQLDSEGLAVKKNQAVSPPLAQSPTPRGKPVPAEEDTYVVQHIDVTEEVSRRLRESRLRRLMDTPSTAQKRKYNAYEDQGTESAVDAEDDGSRAGCSGSEYERTPTKRLKSSGTFEQVGKRKENGNERPSEEERFGSRADFKRRRL